VPSSAAVWKHRYQRPARVVYIRVHDCLDTVGAYALKWCDLDCQYAEWPDSKDLSGACRTFQALYCRKLNRVVQKNGPCMDSLERRKAEGDAT